MGDFDIEERTKTQLEEFANSLKMEWDSPAFDGKMLLLVEYENDKKCYFKLFNHDKVELRTTTGCNCMKRLFDVIQSYDIPNFAIQDSDFARVCGKMPAESNYFITDCHDHEMMCLSNAEVMASVFENLAIAYDSTLVSTTFDELKMLTYFKWYNYHHHLNVNFKGYKPRGKEKADLQSFDSIYKDVKPQSPKCSTVITEADVLAFVRSQKPQSVFEITNGHDFLDMLSRNIEEKYKLHGVTRDSLRPIIYSNFTFNRFKGTQLFHYISSWAGNIGDSLFAT